MTASNPFDERDINAYVDAELDAGRIEEMEAWLAENPDAAARVAAYRRQNEALHSRFDGVLREALPPALTSLDERREANGPRRILLRVAAMIVLLLAGAAGGWQLRGLQESAPLAGPPSYVSRAVGAHLVYAAEIRHPVEVAANQERHLQAWLSKRLGNPLHAPVLQKAGYHLIGGRLLEDAGEPAAQFMYENQAGQRLTVYLRGYKGRNTAFRFSTRDGLAAFYWIDSPFAYALTAPLPRRELLEIAHLVHNGLAPQ